MHSQPSHGMSFERIYGPIPAFWCFSFERYNGLLEGMCNSWLSPEKQMFSKFLHLQHLDFVDTGVTQLSDDFVNHLSLNPFLQSSKPFDSVAMTNVDGLDIAQQMNSHTCEVSLIDPSIKSYHFLSYPHIEKVFTDADMQLLSEMYEHLYPSLIAKISRFYFEIKQVSVHGLQLISSKARSQRSSGIVAHWRDDRGIDSTGKYPLQVGTVNFFFRHDVQLKDEVAIRTLLARVTWFQNHPKRDEFILGLIVCSTLRTARALYLYPE